MKQNQIRGSFSGLGAEEVLFTSEFTEVAFDIYKLCCSPADTVWLEVSQLMYPTPGSYGMGCKLLAVWYLYIYMLRYA